MKLITCAPAVRADACGPYPVDEELALGVHEFHAGTDKQLREQRVCEPDALKHPHAFAVKMHRAGQRKNVLVSLQHEYPQAFDRQQVRQRRTGRAEADDGDIVVACVQRNGFI
ncbi:hypothetical protein QFZ96_008274 [Paraburkholderia youngii]